MCSKHCRVEQNQGIVFCWIFIIFLAFWTSVELLWAVFWSWLACPGFPQVTFIIKTVPKVTNKSDFLLLWISKGVQGGQRKPRDPKKIPHSCSNGAARTPFWSPGHPNRRNNAPHEYPDSNMFTRRIFRSVGRTGRRVATEIPNIIQFEYSFSA